MRKDFPKVMHELILKNYLNKNLFLIHPIAAKVWHMYTMDL